MFPSVARLAALLRDSSFKFTLTSVVLLAALLRDAAMNSELTRSWSALALGCAKELSSFRVERVNFIQDNLLLLMASHM